MKKKILSLVLVLALCLGLVPAAFAAEPQPTATTNINRQDYWGYDQRNTGSFLYENPSGGLTRVEYIKGEASLKKDSAGNGYWAYPDGKIIVEDYDASFRLLSSRTIPQELDYCGGFLAGEEYNYLIFGQANKAENDALEVARIVKYSKEWKRLGATSVSGVNTAEIFAGQEARMAEANGYLYVHTAHTMYAASDGNNHNACMLLQIKTSDMSLVECTQGPGFLWYGIVSHTLNQYILIDQDGYIVTMDHGDGAPRGATLCRYRVKAGPDKTSSVGPQRCDSSVVQQWAGTYGSHGALTGAAITGLAETAKGYVTAFNYDGAAGTGNRSVYLGYTAKDGLNSTVKKLSAANAAAPVLAPTGLNGGYILWNENIIEKNKWGYPVHNITDKLYYTTYSDDGAVGQVKTTTGALSDCQPIYYNGQAVWYVTNNSAPVFYTLDASGVTAHPTSGNTGTVQPSGPATPTPAPTASPSPDPKPTESQKPSTPSTTQTSAVSSSGLTFLDESTYITSSGTAYIDGVQISGGPYKAMAFGGNACTYLLKEDGTLWFRNAWDTSNVTMVKVLDDVVQVQPGVALKKDGTVWTDSPIGTGETPKENTMFKLMDNVKQICSADSCFNGMALKNDGTLWTWGNNYSNSIYDGDPWLGRTAAESDDVYPPAKVLDNVAYIAPTMAVKTDGTLWSWGSNAHGGVGNGSAALQFTPVKVLDNITSAWCSWNNYGQLQKYAMTKDGSVYSWGDNTLNRLGFEGGDKVYKSEFGSTSYQTTPRKSNITGVADILPWGYAQKADGSIWTIGANGLEKKVMDGVKPAFTASTSTTTPTNPTTPTKPTTPTNPTNPTNPTTPAISFSDVKSGDFFADPVKWAIENKITNGTSTTSFSPYETCTVAQILTFLWRSQDEPAPSGKGGFTNVNSASYYADAAQWAKEKGLVTGNTFSANAPCTRAMVVTYLWKLAGSPSAGNSGFSDVPSGADYAKAVSWAVGQGITNGTSTTTFSPRDTCTRGEIVTFLYRAYA